MNGLNESNVLFAQGIAQALNTTVQTSCASATTLCIPSTSKVFVGEVVNQGAGGTYTIFNPTAPTPPPVQYNQAPILASLPTELTYILSATPSPYSPTSAALLWHLVTAY